MARLSVVALVALLASAVAVNQQLDLEKNRPVTKVINLLKDMVDQMEKEGEEAEEVYEKMGCWCTTNDKEKTKAIADGESAINDLSASVEDLAANVARLTAEIGALDSEVAKNEEALSSADSLRQKQLAEFNVEEKDMLTSITGLKGAVVALSKHHEAASLLEVQAIARRHADLLTGHQRRVIAGHGMPKRGIALLQVDQPQSGEIFGVLKAMKESFETNLAQSQKEEMENAAAYEDLKKAKTQEVAAGKDLSETKKQELAAAGEKRAQDEQALMDTRETLATDIEFLKTLKEKCQNVDFDYEEETKTRQLEITATSKALEFLSSDEAHDLFTRTFNPALVQVRSAQAVVAKRRTAAAAVLASAAQRARDPRLALLATTSKMAAFDKVKKNIQVQIDEMMVQKEDEIKKKDFCIAEIAAVERDTEVKVRDKGDQEARVEGLAMTIDKLFLGITEVKKQIGEAEVELKQAGEIREKENKEFQVTVADQKATGKLLTKALEILKGFYDKAAFVQTSNGAAYEPNASSGGVMGMMQNIIDDAKQLEKEAVRGEEAAQKGYDELVAETKATIDAMNKEMTQKSEDKAKAETDKVEAEQELHATMESLDNLGAEERGLHLDCDFLLDNFDVRQKTRDDEVDALKQALAMFSGAPFDSFLQH